MGRKEPAVYRIRNLFNNPRNEHGKVMNTHVQCYKVAVPTNTKQHGDRESVTDSRFWVLAFALTP